MDYIVFDMEWNQPWPGSPSAQKTLSVPIRGEIIQIGAVRITEELVVADEFQVMVKPKVYRHLNRRVSKLTGIKEARLREEGIPFREAMERFRAWCGEEVVFLTWGFDDIGILRENLRLYGMEEGWTEHWYNAQMIFNAQTDGSTSQKALKTASMEQRCPDASSVRFFGICRIRMRRSVPCPERITDALSARSRCWVPAGLPSPAIDTWTWQPVRSTENS